MTDGLFTDNGLFHVMKRADLKPLEEFLIAEVFRVSEKGGKDHR